MSRRIAERGAVAISRRPGSWAERRRVLARHLERATGAPAGSAAVDAAVASYGRYWAESMRLPYLDFEEIDAGMPYEGRERIDAALALGKGVILALPHLGGWEWAGAHLAAGHPLSVVVERLEPVDLFEWFVDFRRRMGMQVIAVGQDAAARCAQALADNHILCLLSDRLIAGTAGTEVEFFGERTELPAGPAALAMRSGAPLLPCAVYFDEETEAHLGVVLPALDVSRRGPRLRDDVRRITQDMATAFEDLIRRAPLQWHLLQPNWPSDLEGLAG
jgi:lauroyl/myristoyl acyltransferase